MEKNIHNVVMFIHIWILIVKAFQFTLKNTGRVVFLKCKLLMRSFHIEKKF